VKKFRIVQVSGNTESSKQGCDPVACLLFQDEGFVGRSKSPFINIGAIPTHGKSFYVYYDEPATDSEKGTFRLVRVDQYSNKEVVVDRGTASKSHIHEGLNTMTFYGSGIRLLSWSFHCEQRAMAEQIPTTTTPQILVIQTLSLGREMCEEVFSALGLKEDVDYRFVDFEHNFDKFVGTERQLFITGTKHGQAEPAIELIRELRAKNPNLIPVSFSSYTIPHVDYIIRNDNQKNDLKHVLTLFLTLSKR